MCQARLEEKSGMPRTMPFLSLSADGILGTVIGQQPLSDRLSVCRGKERTSTA